MLSNLNNLLSPSNSRRNLKMVPFERKLPKSSFSSKNILNFECKAAKKNDEILNHQTLPLRENKSHQPFKKFKVLAKKCAATLKLTRQSEIKRDGRPVRLPVISKRKLSNDGEQNNFEYILTNLEHDNIF
mmetsp:Transcript_32938/g.37755  ORF Transcript_32938/g.37755 Transcript_32938/m.37755 type:complete len:130 (-) Transcript_32938:62-451(-)